MFRLFIDDYEFYFDTLDETCKHLCEVLKALNLGWFWDKGKFIETTFQKSIKKIKIYEIEISHPPIKFKIHYKGKDPLLPELVMYHLKKYINK